MFYYFTGTLHFLHEFLALDIHEQVLSTLFLWYAIYSYFDSKKLHCELRVDIDILKIMLDISPLYLILLHIRFL